MLRFSDRHSAVFTQHASNETPWPQAMQLQGMLLNQLLVLDFHVRQQTWLLGAANGQKGQPQPQPPKPYEYPGAPKQALPEGTKHIGADPIPAADFAHFWADPLGYDGEEG